MFVDNKSAIALTENTMFHSRTKHIDIRHHFIRDHVEKKDVLIFFTPTAYQIADVLTKSLPKVRFIELRAELGLMNNPEIKVEFSNLKEYKSDEESEEEIDDLPEGKAQGGTKSKANFQKLKKTGQAEESKSSGQQKFTKSDHETSDSQADK